MNIKPRKMLLLQSPSTLSREESWLREAYSNIVTNLVIVATNPASTFDSFSANFMGIDSIESNRYEYRALMEVTSYFWGSKGGRGALLEKVLAAAGGTTAANGISLAKIPEWISSVKGTGEVQVWKVTGADPKLKFDLLNVIDDRLVFLEIKNRVDSGGTAAREEALAKKFLKLAEIIQNGVAIYISDGVDRDIAQAFLGLGIKKVEMHAGFLFNVNGNEATIEDDRSKGFYTQSKRLLEEYFKRHNNRFSVKLTYDVNAQRLSFEKDGLMVVVDLLYGSDVTRNFTHEKAALETVLAKVFRRKWNDMLLSVNAAISQRSLLLRTGSNIFNEVKLALSEKVDPNFIASYDKFVAMPDDTQSLEACVKIIKQKINLASSANSLSKSGITDTEIADCIYVYAASRNPYKKVKSSIKV